MIPGTGEWCLYSNILGEGCLGAAQVEHSGIPALGVPGRQSPTLILPEKSQPSCVPAALVLLIPLSDGMWGKDAPPQAHPIPCPWGQGQDPTPVAAPAAGLSQFSYIFMNFQNKSELVFPVLLRTFKPGCCPQEQYPTRIASPPNLPMLLPTGKGSELLRKQL